ncbi:hypothetical protein L208DRAFT_1551686 [Tricholoma matsutake]|nr:hypothetical protein L208DRAFT_1551686 [Tricholoma matsutake 945]
MVFSVVFPWFLLPAFFIMLMYCELAIGYVNTGRDLHQMESNTRSPIFSDFGELLEGIVTALSALSVLLTSLVSCCSAMSFTMFALKLDLNSMECVSEYLNLPQEPPAIIDSNRVPAYWPLNAPNNSLIIVENLVVRYAPDLPAFLHGVSFSLKAGERVGLLGCTGSRKSTLVMSILQFISNNILLFSHPHVRLLMKMDPASRHILIDGFDISTIGLHDLCSHLVSSLCGVLLI